MNSETETASERTHLIEQTITVCSIITIFSAIVGLAIVARNLLPLIFGAILVAVVVNRLARLIGHVLPSSLSRKARVVIVVFATGLIAIASVYAFANSASEQIIKLADRINQSVDTVMDAAKDQPLVQRMLSNESSVNSLIPSSSKSLGAAKNFFASAFGGLTDCLILVILSMYFCVSPHKYRVGAIRLVPTPWRDRLTRLMGDSAETLWRWMLGRLLAMAMVGILFGTGLAIIGVPMPVELGVFACFVTFIPNIGGIAAVIPALLLASQQGSTALLSVLFLYLAIQFSESYLVTPMVQEHQVALPPALVILAQIVGGLLFGFWGVVFATPLVAVSHLWIKRLYVENWLEQNTAAS